MSTISVALPPKAAKSKRLLLLPVGHRRSGSARQRYYTVILSVWRSFMCGSLIRNKCCSIANRGSCSTTWSNGRSSWSWPRERVLVIDEDQGQSAQSAANRNGFQRLLSEVALDHVGLVLGFQMSRLARSCKDWHQLLELCARFGTLLTDLDGTYDPADYNDRLLLGLKGTMSEAELHMMCQRMHQGRSNKARRGAFFNNVPIGYVRGESGQAVMDPDEEVQASCTIGV